VQAKGKKCVGKAAYHIAVDAATIHTHVLEMQDHLIHDIDDLLPIAPRDSVVREGIAKVMLSTWQRQQVRPRSCAE
jgi:hypothetical protein